LTWVLGSEYRTCFDYRLPFHRLFEQLNRHHTLRSNFLGRLSTVNVKPFATPSLDLPIEERVQSQEMELHREYARLFWSK
jgi:hypothetical protein